MSQDVNFRPFTSFAYPALAQLNSNYDDLKALVALLNTLTDFGPEPGMGNTNCKDSERTKSGKVAELPLRLLEVPKSISALRAAIAAVESQVISNHTDEEVSVLAKFNTWGAATMIQTALSTMAAAQQIYAKNKRKAESTIKAGHSVAVSGLEQVA